jgi:CRP-like cAMP-binding protein
MDVIKTLRKCELARGLADFEIRGLAKFFHSRFVRNGDIVFTEGDPGSELYIISTGRVGVFIYSSAQPGEKEKIATIVDGEIFGEFSMLDKSSRSATIIAEEDTDLIFIDYLDFHRYLEEHEHVGFLVMRNIAKIPTGKLRKMDFEIRDLLV